MRYFSLWLASACVLTACGGSTKPSGGSGGENQGGSAGTSSGGTPGAGRSGAGGTAGTDGSCPSQPPKRAAPRARRGAARGWAPAPRIVAGATIRDRGAVPARCATAANGESSSLTQAAPWPQSLPHVRQSPLPSARSVTTRRSAAGTTTARFARVAAAKVVWSTPSVARSIRPPGPVRSRPTAAPILPRKLAAPAAIRTSSAERAVSCRSAVWTEPGNMDRRCARSAPRPRPRSRRPAVTARSPTFTSGIWSIA